MRATLALVSLLLLSLPSSGRSAGPPPAKDWEVDTATYVWVSAVRGRAKANGIESDVDLTYRDVLDQTDFSFMGSALAAYQRRWFFFVDLVFADTSDDDTTGTPLGPLRSDVNSRQIRSQALVGRRVFSLRLSERDDDPRALHLDLDAGLRYWYMKDEVTLELAGTKVKGSHSGWWVDPLVGARVQLQLSDRVSLSVSGDIGGFGIGSASDFTWEVWPVVSYRASERWSVEVGYRATRVDRDQGNDDTYLLWQGPGAGLTFHF